MPKIARSTILISLILMASAAITSAGLVTVNLNRSCDSPPWCPFDYGWGALPAWGSADFSPIAPWTLSFQTGFPVSWSETDTSYSAIFGEGGWFSMTGPGGLTFSGVVTGGSAYAVGNEVNAVDVTFGGQWSNGFYSGGYVSFVAYSYEWIPDVSLQTTYLLTPEPSSLALMASGVLAIWGCRKRFWRPC